MRKWGQFMMKQGVFAKGAAIGAVCLERTGLTTGQGVAIDPVNLGASFCAVSSCMRRD